MSDERPSEHPYVVAGMHRSGTSLLASILASCGIDMGRELVPPDAANPPGYFEDVELLQFQRDLLQKACTSQDGWPDWGWCRTGRLDRRVLDAHRAEAQRLVEGRLASGRDWGFKDPRTSLLLDLWSDILPGARFVFVYRAPWDVADSIRRTSHPAQLARPDFAVRAWATYNHVLLEFVARAPARCLLASVESLADPAHFIARLAQRFGPLPAPPAAHVFRPELLGRSASDDDRVAESLRLAPEIEDVYARLQAAADLPATRDRVAHTERRTPARARFRAGARVSVIIPCCNQGEYILDAVASVEAAAGERHELVIVDDGSDNQTTPPILRYLESRGHHVVHQPNAGLAAARNRGIREGHGDCILPLDSDNTIAPMHLETALDLLDHDPAVGVVYGDAEYFGAKTGRWEVGAFDVERLAAGNYIDACAVFRRSVWQAVGGYDEQSSCRAWEDWEFWLRVVQDGRWSFAYVPEILFQYRVRPASMLHTIEAAPDRIRDQIEYIAAKHHAFFAPRFGRIWGMLAASLVSIRRSYDTARGEIDSREEELASVKAILAARDEELASIKPILAARDEELASVKYVLAARDEEVAALRAALAAEQQRRSRDI